MLNLFKRRILALFGLSIWSGYVARAVYRYIAVVLVGLLGLFFIFDFQAELSDVGTGSYTLNKALLFTVLQLPSRFYDAMPIATVAGAILGLAGLATSSEISVLRASSMRPLALVRVLLLAGIPLIIITLIVGELVLPLAEQRAASMRLQALGGAVSTELRSGIWLRDTQADGGVNYVNIPKINTQGAAPLLRRYSFDARMRLVAVLDAKDGQYRVETAGKNAAWVFASAASQAYSPETGARSAVQTQAQWLWETTLTPASLEGLQKNPERLDMVSLVNNVFYQLKNGLDVRKSLTTLLRRLTHPLVLWVMLMIAAPFAYVRARGGAVAGQVFLGIVTGVMFYAGSRLFEFLTVVQGWPAWVSAPTPIALGLLMAAGLFWRFHRLH